MASLVKISEAASIALHAMSFLAHPAAQNSRGKFSVKEIASHLKVSEPHLSKVLQRLAKSGLVNSTRGPKGGFALSRESKDITLLEIFETIEGPIERTRCLFGHPVCQGSQCIIGDLLEPVDRQAAEYLAGARLSEMTKVFGGNSHGGNQKDNPDR